MAGDPTPPDPESLTADMPAGGDEAAGAAENSGWSDDPLIQGLLSTEPHEQAETPSELAIRGTKKFVKGAFGAKVKSGKTAVEDWAQAAIGYYQQSDEQAEPDGFTRTDGATAGDDAVDWNQADE